MEQLYILPSNKDLQEHRHSILVHRAVGRNGAGPVIVSITGFAEPCPKWRTFYVLHPQANDLLVRPDQEMLRCGFSMTVVAGVRPRSCHLESFRRRTERSPRAVRPGDASPRLSMTVCEGTASDESSLSQAQGDNPKSDPLFDSSRPSANPGELTALEQRHILLVEDNPDDVKLTLKAFQRYGLSNRVDVAADGVEALEYLHGTGKFAGHGPTALPALILLDLKMPRMNGIEALQRIRADEKTKLVPVVVLTTSNEERDKTACSELGVNGYVRKPVKLSEFNEVVQKLANWLMPG